MRVKNFCGLAVAGDRFPNGEAIIAPLTKCCEASGKGGPDGVQCRACGQPVSNCYGRSGFEAIQSAASEQGCSDPEGCAHYLLGIVEQAYQELSRLS